MTIDSNGTPAGKTSLAEARQVDIVNGQINSQELFQGEKELLIRHGAETYRLRLTGLNKLILTK
jgi:hemin uptake protein HemP